MNNVWFLTSTHQYICWGVVFFFNLAFFKKFNVYQSLIATLIFAILMTLYVCVLKGNKNKK
ncbi:hypothetical protein BUZ00_00365 [Staphylococcus gallinarum]|nr:hypothetical protein BUZ00_00365 [Staphylococcus gallinarum]PTK91475.1 hypothetical protein BUZ03_05535 [Staphylococcus gallinarum]RIL24400.1 hypothetical protein BUY99_02325 [Staphylococcus gallinarum]RIL26336.1 hypothetical protein BUY97_00300 [Staphylococcus gallinarum]RIL30926.1 hypothetical protein BUY95_00380 [Staphylococcus gallinarum]